MASGEGRRHHHNLVPLAALISREMRSEKMEKPTVRYGHAAQSRKGEDYFLIKTDCQRVPGNPSSTFSAFAVILALFLPLWSIEYQPWLVCHTDWHQGANMWFISFKPCVIFWLLSGWIYFGVRLSCRVWSLCFVLYLFRCFFCYGLIYLLLWLLLYSLKIRAVFYNFSNMQRCTLLFKINNLLVVTLFI